MHWPSFFAGVAVTIVLLYLTVFLVPRDVNEDLREFVDQKLKEKKDEH